MKTSNIQVIQKDFYLIHDAFSQEEALDLLHLTLKRGADEKRGFHRPKLRPNRFGTDLSYPIKKYMCYGLYWDPVTYFYEEKIPKVKLHPYPIPDFLLEKSKSLVSLLFPHHMSHFRLDSTLVNYYCVDDQGKDSKLSLHQDKDEGDKTFPVIGFSLGSTAKFVFEDHLGMLKEILIPDRSCYLFGDSSRLMRHGVKNVLSKTLPTHYDGLLRNKERINFTSRKVV